MGKEFRYAMSYQNVFYVMGTINFTEVWASPVYAASLENWYT